MLEVVAAGPGSLAERLEASEWEIVLDGVPVEAAAAGLAIFLAADAVEVERMTKNGLRKFDARVAVLTASCRAGIPLGVDVAGRPLAAPNSSSARGDTAPAPSCAILRVVVRHVTPAVRPDDVLSGLCRVADLAPPQPPRVTRLAQGPLDTESVGVLDPLAPDRQTAWSAEGSAPDQARAHAG